MYSQEPKPVLLRVTPYSLTDKRASWLQKNLTIALESRK